MQPPTSNWSKAELTPHALVLFERVKAELPRAIAARLRSNRTFTTHGSYRTLFLFDVWDENQTDVLDRKHFKYCLGYDRRPGAKQDGYFHLWLNRIRIYRERDSIVPRLDRELPKVVPRGFTWHTPDRAFNIGCEFSYPQDLRRLPDLLAPKYVALISAVHPVLMPIIDQFTTPLTPGERRAVVAERGRLPFTAPGVHDRARVREYTRSIPPAWRQALLEKHAFKCAICGCDLRSSPAHIDHIVPFSKGGATVLQNLQPLCGPCNLSKGNR
jgi:hypothetical protein